MQEKEKAIRRVRKEGKGGRLFVFESREIDIRNLVK